MNILNKQIDSIYDRQKNLYSKYPHYSQQNAESKKVCEQEKITATSGKDAVSYTHLDVYKRQVWMITVRQSVHSGHSTRSEVSLVRLCRPS